MQTPSAVSTYTGLPSVTARGIGAIRMRLERMCGTSGALRSGRSTVKTEVS